MRLATKVSRAARPALAALVLQAIVCADANADVFFSHSAFQAATSGLTTLDFSTPETTLVSPSYTNSGVTFTSSLDMHLVDQALGGFAAGTFYGSDYFLWQNANPQNGIPNKVNISLPGPMTAVGFDYVELRGQADIYTVVIVIGSDTFDLPTSPLGALFFGFTSSTPFSALSIADLGPIVGNHPTIDNFSFGASVVPEPGSLALLGIALGAFGLTRRRKNA